LLSPSCIGTHPKIHCAMHDLLMSTTSEIT
jgi:hypothetical protein